MASKDPTKLFTVASVNEFWTALSNGLRSSMLTAGPYSCALASRFLYRYSRLFMLPVQKGYSVLLIRAKITRAAACPRMKLSAPKEHVNGIMNKSHFIDMKKLTEVFFKP